MAHNEKETRDLENIERDSSVSFIQKAVDKFNCDGTIDRLISRADEEQHERSMLNARILLVGFQQFYSIHMWELLRECDVKSITWMPKLDQIFEVLEVEAAFSHIFVYFDAYVDAGSGIDELVAFRLQSDHVVVICSDQVSTDDLGIERLPICDASLRLPLSSIRLRRGIAAANTNKGARIHRRKSNI